MAEITCFFSPQSGYAYLGHERLRTIARERGARIVWRPVDILKVFAEGGSTAPAKQSPQRNAYRKKDVTRWAALRGIPINVNPAHWPTDTLPACRMIAAALADGIDAGDFIGACLGAVWAENLQISELPTLIALADAVGLDGAALAAKAAGPEAQALVEKNTADAVAAGVFGSPSYIVDGELYFGQDRLDFVAAALDAGK